MQSKARQSCIKIQVLRLAHSPCSKIMYVNKSRWEICRSGNFATNHKAPYSPFYDSLTPSLTSHGKTCQEFQFGKIYLSIVVDA